MNRGACRNVQDGHDREVDQRTQSREEVEVLDASNIQWVKGAKM